MKKTKGFTKRMLSWVMTLVMVCSVMTGGSIKALAGEDAEADVTVWAGGTATKLTTTLQATKWEDAAGKTKNGAIVWIVKNEPTEIEFNTTKHTVTTKSDTTIATVSKGTVKGKTEGKVYVYAIDTGSMTNEVFEVQVKAAPTAVTIYNTADITADTTKYSSATVPEGQKIKIYYAGTTGSAKKGDWKLLTDEDLTYTLTVPAKYTDYITVTQDTKDNSFEITVKEGIMAALSKGKVCSVSLSVKNDQTGKKASFKLVIGNLVKNITLTTNSEETKLEKDEESAVYTVTMDSPALAAQTASLKETTVLYNASLAGTDTTKIVSLPWSDAYKFNASGVIVADGKLSAEQKKVTMKAVKAKDGTYTYNITAKKGTKPGTEAYFAIYHNSYDKTNGTGFQIVKVTVGEANSVKTLTFDKTEGNDINKQVILAREGGTKWNYTVLMPAPTKAAEYAYITETITLTDTTEGAVGTDGSTIYKLPNGTEDAYTIAKNGMVTVNGALSAAQKKVSMAAVKGKDGEFKITVPKGTPEGTKAYFMLFHNPDVYSIITVIVGTVNPTVKSELAKDSTDASKAELKTETLDKGKMTVVSVPYSETKQTVVLKETKTAKDTENATITDANVVLRMASADGYEVALNKSTVTAKGTLSAAQKKISVAYQKKSTEVINVTVAAKTPVGTETYFIIYHNDETVGSGTGYHIVKVVVTEAEAAE